MNIFMTCLKMNICLPFAFKQVANANRHRNMNFNNVTGATESIT